MKTRTWVTPFVVLVALLVGPMAVWAGGTPPVAPSGVPGKEYSNHLDEDAAGALDNHQNIWWDGVGGAGDADDFSTALPPGLAEESQVDALAHHDDYLLREIARDEATMVTSLTGMGDVFYTAPAHHAPVHGLVPKVGIWASASTVNAASLPDDVDGLELWGPDVPSSDANMFSLMFDPAIVGGPRVSVWSYASGTATPFISATDLALAIGREDLSQEIDLDALMVNEDGNEQFGPGDRILFSIAPLDTFDGGEIWAWTFGGPATFLVHGGETWDTAHSVTNHFGLPTDPRLENINALEAIVPEPATLSLLAISGLAILRRRRRS